MKRPKHILTLTILILQTVFLSSASNDHILKAKSPFFLAESSYPEIPSRPTLGELSMTIQLDLDKNDLVHKYKFSNGLIQADNEIVKTTLLDKSVESVFLISPDKLFLLTVRAAMELDLSLKKINAAKKEIIILDKFRNKFVIDVFEKDDKSKINIQGYKSFFGKIALEQTMQNIIEKINELNNESKTT